MLKKLFQNKFNTQKDTPDNTSVANQSNKPEGSSAESSGEDALEETGTFMLTTDMLKECEDLEDLLNDV